MLNLLRYQTSLASHVELPNTAWENSMIIASLYGLTPPNPSQAESLAKKVAACKETMGDKWLLAIHVSRKDKK
jgi:hypothetical protein